MSYRGFSSLVRLQCFSIHMPSKCPNAIFSLKKCGRVVAVVYIIPIRRSLGNESGFSIRDEITRTPAISFKIKLKIY